MKKFINKDRNYKQIEAYTDLALEEREKFEKNVEIEGVAVKKTHNRELKMTTTLVNIQTAKGADIMGKPKGHYITMETVYIKEADEEKQARIIEELVKNINILIRANVGKKGKVLVVGLGNSQATPDALGPRTVSMVEVKDNIYCIAPGVLAQTGMETQSIIKGIVKEMKPDLILAIDSLAARSTRRVTTTIQLTDTGIKPGSGVGNHRAGLDRENLGTTVIAIGVPMVVNSVTIVNDTMNKLINLLSQAESKNCLSDMFGEFSEEEKYQLFEEIMSDDMEKMYVTPKDVDEIVDNLSRIIASSINNI